MAEFVALPFAVGISKMRNALVAEARARGAKFIIMLEDDFVLDEGGTQFEAMREVLDERPEIGAVAGALRYEGDPTPRIWANNVITRPDVAEYEVLPITDPEMNVTADSGVRWFPAEYVYNFFMARVEGLPEWDDDLKTCVEHIDWALRCKAKGFHLACAPDVWAHHESGKNDPEYAAHRTSYESWEVFYKKTGWRCGRFMDGYIVHDFEHGKRLTYPAYVFDLLKAASKAGLTTSPGETRLQDDGAQGRQAVTPSEV
jgi:GT2 family glycosyltransferase